MQKEQQKYALVIVIFIGLILAYAVYKFLGVFVGALILFTVFNPLYIFLTKKAKWKSSLSALFVLFLSLIIVVVPLFIIASLGITQVVELSKYSDEITSYVQNSLGYIHSHFPEIDLFGQLETVIEKAFEYLQTLIGPFVQNVTSGVVTIVLMCFVLYSMFVEQKKWESWIYRLLPFTAKNSRKILKEFENIAYSTIVSSGVISLIQGLLLGICFWAFGLPGYIVWGIVGAFVAFLPVVGTPLIWIPASLYLLATGSIWQGIVFFLLGFVIISNIDNVLRPLVNKHVANIHPLTSLLGIFFGLAIFGVAGIILGPLLISYFFLLLEIYREEFGSENQ